MTESTRLHGRFGRARALFGGSKFAQPPSCRGSGTAQGASRTLRFVGQAHRKRRLAVIGRERLVTSVRRTIPWTGTVEVVI